MSEVKKKTTLINGVQIPSVGFGTWQIPDGDDCTTAVKCAIEAGYRHIDTAAMYKNERSVGEAVRSCQIAREDIFVTSKLWNKCRGYDMTFSGFERTMEKLGLEYLDLYLIHWPASPSQYDDFDRINLQTWRAMIDIYKSGRVKAIGVSNFLPHHLASLCECEIAPMVNQIELHPGYLQKETIDFCRERGIVIEAWSPLGSGRVLSDERLMRIADKYGKSTAQISVRWCLENGFIPLPRSSNQARIKENIDVFDFELSDEDIEEINSFEVFGTSGYHPDEIDF